MSPKVMQPNVRSAVGAVSHNQRHAAGQASPVAWVPPADLDRQRWAAAGRRFGAISRCSQWWIGDWIRYGTQKWGEKYVHAARITGYDIASLRNIAWVASQFDPSLRSDKLSWSHHALLAPLKTDEQAYWLERAAAEGFSVVDLRTELRALRSGKKRKQSRSRELSRGEHGTVTCPECGHELHLPSDGTADSASLKRPD